MRARIRVAATIGSALAVTGMLAPNIVPAPVAQAGPMTEGISFTSQPTVAALLAHYTVTPGAPNIKASAAPTTPSMPDDRQLPRLSPKHQLPRTPSTVQGNAPASPVQPSLDGQVPPASASFIAQQGSKPTCSYFAQGCNPPDMALAASPEAVLQGVNTQWEVLDPSGHVQPGWPLSAQQFFGVPNATNANGTPCDLRAMALVTVAITVERLAPLGERVARATGVVAVATGFFLIARAAAFL